MMGLMVVVGEGDEEKIGDGGEVVKVGRLDGLDCLLFGGFTGKLNCTRRYLIN
jgi:hypothetical protein